ncbi:MAG: restriction endonuclease subunit S [Bacteroidales bacterium]|nr:restriction endonuclease subunit S [Bacteroidales bacterium]
MNELHIDKTHWKKYRFDEVCRQVNEATKDPATEGLDHVIGLEHIEPNNLHITHWDTLDKETTFTRKFKKGQVLFGRRRAYQRKVAYAEFDGICSGDILVFEAIEKVMLPELLPFLIQSEGFFQKALETSAGSLSPRTKFKELADYEFLLPPKAEQKRLAELLWAADEVVEKEKREKSQLDFYRQSKLKSIFQSANTHVRLKDLPIEEINGLWKTEDSDSIEISVIRSTEFSDYGAICFDKLEPMPVKISQYKTRKLLHSDIIVERSGGGPDQPVGRVCYFEKEDGEYSFSNFTSCIRVSNNNVILPKYLFYFLEYYWEMGGTDRIQNQTTGIRNLDYELYKMIKVPMLTIDEQKQAINVIDQIQQSIFASKTQIEQSQQIKQELINKVF